MGETQIVPTQCQVDELIVLMEEAVVSERALLAQWLRLAFHDAGTFDRNRNIGGANGCLLTDDRMRLEQENDFLDLALEPLQKIRDNWSGRASAADLIQFAGFFSVVRQKGGETGLNDSKQIELQQLFEWGRMDEDNCDPTWTHNLPGFELGVEPTDIPMRCTMAGSEIKTKMMDRNGFTAMEATALIGAHTIGLTRHIFTEQLAGPWATNGSDEATTKGPVFDNGFHHFLINDVTARTPAAFAESRHPFNVDFPTWFRFEEEDINHLDTDIALAFPSQDTNIHPDYHQFTQAFANDNNLFIESFMKAYDKMSRLGHGNRQLFPSSPCAPKAFAAPGASSSSFATGRIQAPSGGGGGVAFQLELQSSFAEAGVKLQRTAVENQQRTEFLTTPLNL